MVSGLPDHLRKLGFFLGKKKKSNSSSFYILNKKQNESWDQNKEQEKHFTQPGQVFATFFSKRGLFVSIRLKN